MIAATASVMVFLLLLGALAVGACALLGLSTLLRRAERSLHRLDRLRLPLLRGT